MPLLTVFYKIVTRGPGGLNNSDPGSRYTYANAEIIFRTECLLKKYLVDCLFTYHRVERAGNLWPSYNIVRKLQMLRNTNANFRDAMASLLSIQSEASDIFMEEFAFELSNCTF